MANTVSYGPLLQRILSMQHELNDLLRQTFGPDPFGVDFDPERWERWMPQADLYKRDDRWIVRADLPGVNLSDVSLSIIDNQLLIQGERRPPESPRAAEAIFQECPYGPFERVITFPVAVPEDQIHAHYDRGVLYVTFPSVDVTKKKIEIESGDSTENGPDAA